MDKNTINSVNSIPVFYTGQSIFLTGATGFLGKVYIEKMLRSCSDVREIFLLIRPKKGLSISERLEKILNLPLYDKLREEQPSNFKKLIPISGDISQENLGLSAIDRQLLIERVTIIIHNAASVKFNNTLKYAILTNTRSTRDVCILAEKMKNLIALVYISTAYVNLDKPFIEEKPYPVIDDWSKMIKVVESLDEHILNIFTAKCLDYFPNTYLFSKNLAENIIQEYSSFLPCAIVRPSIVTASLREPFPGWIDNFSGPYGLLTMGGKGLLRTVLASSTIFQNYIPIDIVINTIILTTWKLGLTTFTPKSTFFIVNCTMEPDKDIIFREKCKLGIEIIKEIPFEEIFWTPKVIFTENLTIYFLLTILWHILPAIITDCILKLSGRRPMLLGLQRKLYVSNQTLKHFTLNEWKFDNTNRRKLMSLIPSDNREMFSIDLTHMDMNKYIRNSVVGIKRYLLHEKMNRLDAAKAHQKRVNIFVVIFKTIIIIGMLWIIYNWIFF